MGLGDHATCPPEQVVLRRGIGLMRRGFGLTRASHRPDHCLSGGGRHPREVREWGHRKVALFLPMRSAPEAGSIPPAPHQRNGGICWCPGGELNPHGLAASGF